MSNISTEELKRLVNDVDVRVEHAELSLNTLEHSFGPNLTEEQRLIINQIRGHLFNARAVLFQNK
ncbi:TPA: hypothetical protein QCW96_005018 [Bacillus pacificus]|uniref:hypothetical protein n=1 Tax=Bacillus cereus group TaxID=86661 RepID=UPI003841D30E|nr:hypothetical protein [Bacillus pacificus]